MTKTRTTIATLSALALLLAPVAGAGSTYAGLTQSQAVAKVKSYAMVMTMAQTSSQAKLKKVAVWLASQKYRAQRGTCSGKPAWAITILGQPKGDGVFYVHAAGIVLDVTYNGVHSCKA